jgi:hypothetical protein
MKTVANTPLRKAWGSEKAKLGELKRKIMQVMGISTDVQFYDFVNGHRKNVTEDQQKKVAELFGRPASELFPDDTVYFD